MFLDALSQNVPRLVLYLDNLESLLVGPDDPRAAHDEGAMGEWRSEALAAIWRALKELAGERELVVVVSCRYRHPDFAGALLPVSPLQPDARYRMMGWFPALRRLSGVARAVVKASGKRQSVNAISAVNPRGAFWYMTYKGSLNAKRFVEFLGCFMAGRRKNVFLVLDGHPSHRANLVQEYVQTLEGNLELHFLPGYSPELNPDEYVWSYIKKNGASKKPLKENESLREGRS